MSYQVASNEEKICRLDGLYITNLPHTAAHAIMNQQPLEPRHLPLATVLLILATVLLTACGTQPVKPVEGPPPVFPAPPDAPRFIYERTLTFSDNVEQTTAGDRFRLFALGEKRSAKALVKPFGVAVRHGRVYVTDTAQRVVALFDIPGARYVEIGAEKPGQLIKPMGIDVSSRGEVFVSDMTQRVVQVYDLDGKYLRTLGGKDILKRPSGVAVNPGGTRLYVVETGGIDTDAHHVYMFDAQSGALLQTIGKRGVGDGEFNIPLQAAIAPDGTLHVVDKGNFRVQTFNPDGSFARTFGAPGRFPGQFASPKGIATDPDGNIYVVDTAFGNFQIFNKDGQLLMFIGERGASGAPAKYMLPAGIDVDEDGRIYVVDQFFRKVDVFRPAGLRAEEGFAVVKGKDKTGG